MADLVTLAELNDVLNLDGDTSHDIELALYIDAVTAHVRERLRPERVDFLYTREFLWAIG